MLYGKIDGLSKDISRLVFGTATPALFAAVAPSAGEKEINEAYDSIMATRKSGKKGGCACSRLFYLCKLIFTLRKSLHLATYSRTSRFICIL